MKLLIIALTLSLTSTLSFAADQFTVFGHASQSANDCGNQENIQQAVNSLKIQAQENANTQCAALLNQEPQQTTAHAISDFAVQTTCKAFGAFVVVTVSAQYECL